MWQDTRHAHRFLTDLPFWEMDPADDRLTGESGTYGGGLMVYDGKRTQTIRVADGLPDNIINAVRVTPDGAVWTGTNEGAARFDGTAWSTLTTADGLTNHRVECIAPGRDPRQRRRRIASGAKEAQKTTEGSSSTQIEQERRCDADAANLRSHRHRIRAGGSCSLQ